MHNTDAEKYLPFVKKLAHRIRIQFNPPMEIDELVSCGTIGLQEAMGRYDASTKIKFETYAYYRVRGAMIEGISRQCTLSRHMAAKLRLLTKSNDYMEGMSADLGGRTEKDPAVSASILAGVLRDLASIHTLHTAVSTAIKPGERGGETEIEFVDDASAAKHEEAVQSSEIKTLMERLPGEQAEVLRLYYFQDKTLEEAGKEMGVTKGWASKLHNSAIKKLRLLMQEKE